MFSCTSHYSISMPEKWLKEEGLYFGSQFRMTHPSKQGGHGKTISWTKVESNKIQSRTRHFPKPIASDLIPPAKLPRSYRRMQTKHSNMRLWWVFYIQTMTLFQNWLSWHQIFNSKVNQNQQFYFYSCA